MIPCQIIQRGFSLIFWRNLRSVPKMGSDLLVSQSILLENPLSKVTVLFHIFLHLCLHYLLIEYVSRFLQFQGKEESEKSHYRLGQISHKMIRVLSMSIDRGIIEGCVSPFLNFLIPLRLVQHDHERHFLYQ